jgi:integrase
VIQQVALADFARSYAQCTPLSKDYATRLIKRAVALEQHSGTSCIALTLTEANVNGFLKSLTWTPRTINSYREDLLTLWNAAADDDLAEYPRARRIQRLKPDPLIVECYSIEEARKLLKAAGKLKGTLANGVKRSRYWQAAILFGWDSGLRRGDVWRVRRDAIREDGSLRMVQHKSKQIVQVRLHPKTVAALDEIGLPQPLAWPHETKYFGTNFKKLVRLAGVNRGTFRWLRRSSGSYVEAQQPGSGHKHLGHSCPAIFTKHYDARLMGSALPQPPEL